MGTFYLKQARMGTFYLSVYLKQARMGTPLFEIGMNGNLLFECFIVNRHEWELLQYSVYLKQA